MRPVKSVAVFLSALAFAHPGSLASVPPPTQVQNLGLAAAFPDDGGFDASGDLVAFVVAEADQGGVDLNGDGDAVDRVLHVHDVMTGATINVGIAGTFEPVVGDRFVAFLVRESAQGADLNGDGDVLDHVLHVYDHVAGTVANTLLVASAAQNRVVPSGRRALIVVREIDHGIDWNGDGDAVDLVVHAYDVASAVLTNLAMAISGLPIDAEGDLGLVTVSEAAQGGVDLDGDGDATDHVFHAIDLTTNVVSNLSVAGFLGSSHPNAVDGGRAAFLVSEGQMGVDLNADGDAADNVLHTYVAQTGFVVNAGAAAETSALEGLLVALRRYEALEGVDLNGDGDTWDRVVSVYDVGAGVVTNLGIASFEPIAVGEGFVAVMVEEWMQEVDLNGDGDLSDRVPFVHVAASGTTTNVGVAMAPEFGPILIDGGRVAFRGLELSEGRDLNGDGDASDAVLHVYTVASGELWNTGLAAIWPAMAGGHVACSVSEPAQGGVDLNGDGDAAEAVLHVLDPATRTTINLGIAGSTVPSGTAGGAFAFGASEASQGGTDGNADGDAGDEVLHVVSNLPSACGALDVHGQGCPGLAAEAPALVVNGCAAPGCALTFTITDGAPGSVAWLVFGLNAASLPIGGGCTLNVSPLLPIVAGPIALSAEGSRMFTALVPAATPPGSVVLQGFSFPTSGGLSATNGARIVVP